MFAEYFIYHLAGSTAQNILKGQQCPRPSYAHPEKAACFSWLAPEIPHAGPLLPLRFWEGGLCEVRQLKGLSVLLPWALG